MATNKRFWGNELQLDGYKVTVWGQLGVCWFRQGEQLSVEARFEAAALTTQTQFSRKCVVFAIQFDIICSTKYELVF